MVTQLISKITMRVTIRDNIKQVRLKLPSSVELNQNIFKKLQNFCDELCIDRKDDLLLFLIRLSLNSVGLESINEEIIINKLL